MNHRVLIVDDEPALRSALSMLLETTGASVEAVESGELALAACEGADFQLILLDIGLPGIGGVETAAGIWKKSEEGRRPTIVFLSGDAGSRNEAAQLAEEYNARHEYLMKPVAPDVLLSHVVRCLSSQPAT